MHINYQQLYQSDISWDDDSDC